MGQTLDCFRKGIVFTQSHQPEEAFPDSYDKCEPGLMIITFEARASIGGRNLTDEVGDDTQPCEELDASLTISIEAVGDISLAEP